jgi:hypothetical protein
MPTETIVEAVERKPLFAASQSVAITHVTGNLQLIACAGSGRDVIQVRLEENVRSGEGVVTVARDFIRQAVRQLSKEMKPAQAQPQLRSAGRGRTLHRRNLQILARREHWMASQVARATKKTDAPRRLKRARK